MITKTADASDVQISVASEVPHAGAGPIEVDDHRGGAAKAAGISVGRPRRRTLGVDDAMPRLGKLVTRSRRITPWPRYRDLQIIAPAQGAHAADRPRPRAAPGAPARAWAAEQSLLLPAPASGAAFSMAAGTSSLASARRGCRRAPPLEAGHHAPPGCAMGDMSQAVARLVGAS